jgi:hypothetical protein
MDNAGIKKTNTHGASSKKVASVAYPKSKMLLSFKVKRYNAHTMRNKAIAM